MSRNPYLAASRPSSYTRSSRASKATSGLASSGRSSSALSRSRSSAALGSSYSSSVGSSNSYSSAAGYTPHPSSWLRSVSSTRLNQSRQSNEPTSAQTHYNSASRNAYNSTPTSRASDQVGQSTARADSIGADSISSNSRSNSTQNLSNINLNDDESDSGTSRASSHLENYQRSKLQQPIPRTGSLPQSIDAINDSSLDKRRSADSPNSSDSDLRKGGDTLGASNRLQRQGQLLKSNSVDVVKSPNSPDKPNSLLYSISVDRLLIRSESMTERELRKIFRELVIEFERLKTEVKDKEDQEKEAKQEWIRAERQMQRKISELEEENKQLEQFKLEIQRLKEERSSLIRVVSKLSKHN